MRATNGESMSGQPGNKWQGKKLGTILVGLGLIDADQERAALEYSARWGLPFGQTCVRMGLLDEHTVTQGLSVQMGAPSVALAGLAVAPEVLALVPASIAERDRVIPLRVDRGAGRAVLLVAVSNPRNLGPLDELTFRTGMRVSPVLASDADLDAALFRFYGLDVQRHTKASSMVELELEGALHSSAGGSDAQIIHDPLTLALDFLPVVRLR